MNITITGRHVNISNNLKEYSEKKITKLETYFNQIVDAKLIMYLEKLDHAAEVMINGDGVQFHGIEKAADFFSAIDLLFEKMERQIVKYKEKHSSHKAVNPSKAPHQEEAGAEGRRINLKLVSDKPVDRVEAYLEMKNDRKDFILFKQGVNKVDSEINYANKNYAIIFHKNGVHKMAEIPLEMIRDENIQPEHFIEHDLLIEDDSPVKPKIKFKKNSGSSIESFSLIEALKEFEESGLEFMPFFNVESQFFNIIYKSGRDYEVMVPNF